jgi:hypothetical protein
MKMKRQLMVDLKEILSAANRAVIVVTKKSMLQRRPARRADSLRPDEKRGTVVGHRSIISLDREPDQRIEDPQPMSDHWHREVTRS